MTINDLGVGQEEIEKKKRPFFWKKIIFKRHSGGKNKFISDFSSTPQIINGRPLRAVFWIAFLTLIGKVREMLKSTLCCCLCIISFPPSSSVKGMRSILSVSLCQHSHGWNVRQTDPKFGGGVDLDNILDYFNEGVYSFPISNSQIYNFAYKLHFFILDHGQNFEGSFRWKHMVEMTCWAQ